MDPFPRRVARVHGPGEILFVAFGILREELDSANPCRMTPAIPVTPWNVLILTRSP